MAKKIQKGIVYYTDNTSPKNFLVIFRDWLKRVAGDIPIVWVSQKPIPEDNNIVVGEIGRCHKSLCYQILTGVENIDADILYFAEDDVLYHPSHYEFVPPEKDIFYYNINRWWLRHSDGLASFKNGSSSLSHLIAYRELLLEEYRQRYSVYERGINLRKMTRTEPGKHKSKLIKYHTFATFVSRWPNVDFRHKWNHTKSNRFKPDDDRFILSDGIPGWGKTKGRYKEFLREINLRWR